jgi:hypothetical protein
MERITLTMLLLVSVFVPVLAGGPGGPPATPIDGGLSLLLAAGGVYGVRKLTDRRKG